MTRISVNDIRIPQNFPMPGVNKSGGNGFQAVLNEQTGNDKADMVQDQDTESVQKTEGKSDVERALERTEAAQAAQEQTEVKADNDVSSDTSDMEEDVSSEEAMAVIAEMLASLKQQIMETLNVSEEEFAGMLEQMELTEMDLLDAGKLSDFVLGLTGAEDSLALLTDEQLLQDYQEIMNELNALLEQGSDELGISVQELGQLVETDLADIQDSMVKPADDANTETQEVTGPVIEVTGTVSEKEGAETDRQDMQGESRNHEADLQQTEDVRNVFQANQTVRDFQNNLTQVADRFATESTLTFSETTRQIMDQVMDYMKIQLQPEVSNLEMQLHPASLGTLQIQVEVRGEAVTAKFIAENETVKAALETQMVELKEQFQQQGMKVDAVEVSVQTQTFEQSFEQGRQAQQAAENENRPRPRRLNLSELSSESEMAEMTNDAERIAVEMMAANGNTVDYMA